ncbi:MAG: aldo/keto reductase [Candidatus Omnitrophica bacterium]|nr:aldo/keto reductase [Candidatus Omnitrophota bacterium]
MKNKHAKAAMSKISKLTLGTAQIGFNYGIANTGGKLNMTHALELLRVAYDSGVTSFDTSYSYDDSERIIGKFISTGANSHQESFISSKLPKINAKKDADYKTIFRIVKNYVKESLKRLTLQKIPLYYLHDASDMTSYQGKVMESLVQLREEGLIDALGVSVYHPQEARAALAFKVLRAIQLPVNLFDHRFIADGLLQDLHRSGKIIFARSIYLQGLFFLAANKVPRKMKYVLPYLEKLNGVVNEEKISIDELAVGFVKNLPGITSLVIGAESKQQILRNAGLIAHATIGKKTNKKLLDIFSAVPGNVVIPYLWGKEN